MSKSRTAQSEGIRLHHEEKRRKLLLLAALCGGYAKVGNIDLYTGVCVIHVNEKKWECTLDDRGLPHVGPGLADHLLKVMEPL